MTIKSGLIWSAKALLAVIVLAVIALIILIADLSVNEFRPPVREKADIVGTESDTAPTRNEFSLLSWNIGYCGLGKEMDFFYEGGHMVMPEIEDFQRYLNGVLNQLYQYEGVDFILLQEVDLKARRSYFINQQNLVSKFFRDFPFAFAKNYVAGYIPFPVFTPMGKVESGIMTLSRMKPAEAWRIAAPAGYSWPKRLFFPHRCFLLTRHHLPGNRDLVVVNLHNSAFSDAGAIRESELWHLKDLLISEYVKGNYVVAGGDWNQNPPGFRPDSIRGDAGMAYFQEVQADFMPRGWKWAYDKTSPTNREVISPYIKGKTRTTTIDFFLVSPNIQVNSVRTVPAGFEFSDHQPVILDLKVI